MGTSCNTPGLKEQTILLTKTIQLLLYIQIQQPSHGGSSMWVLQATKLLAQRAFHSSVDNVGTTNPIRSNINIAANNTFFADPTNHSETDILAHDPQSADPGPILARFRLANWGAVSANSPAWSDIPDRSTDPPGLPSPTSLPFHLSRILIQVVLPQVEDTSLALIGNRTPAKVTMWRSTQRIRISVCWFNCHQQTIFNSLMTVSPSIWTLSRQQNNHPRT